MSNQPRIAITVLTVGLFIVTACNLPTGVPPLPQPSQPAEWTATTLPPSATLPAIASPQATGTLAGTPIPTFTAVVLSTPLPVVITASTGNLNIRRGPGVGYNPIGGLLKGETSTATARDDIGGWLFIALPGQPDKSGWVNTQTQYSTVVGDVMALSVLSVDAPKAAYFRNCTFHPMLVQPGGVVIPPQGSAPLNQVQFNPGDYIIKDGAVAGNPEVMEATLLEGYTVDIRTDATPSTTSCP